METNYSSIWLFSFTGYSYCQGDEDYYGDTRLITFSLPCEESEARKYLVKNLEENHVKYNKDSIVSKNIKIINS